MKPGSIRLFLLSAYFWINLLSTALACDVCGSGGGISSGILPRIDRPMVGLLSNYLQLTYSDETLVQNQTSRIVEDLMYGTTFFARVNMNYRTQVFFSVPYGVNVRKEEMSTSIISGIGDISCQIHYHLIDPVKQLGNEWSTTILIGTGVILPTGKYQQRDTRKQVLPNFIQIGSGAFALQSHLNTVFAKKGSGFHFESFYNYQFENELFYRRGHQLRSGINYFRKLTLSSSSSIVPTLGINVDYFTADKDFGKPIAFTQRQQVNTHIRLDYFSKSFSFGGFINVPIWQRQKAGQPVSMQIGGQILYFI